MSGSALCRPRWLWTVAAVLLAVLLLVVADCDDDTGPGSYNPTSGDHIWYPKRKI